MIRRTLLSVLLLCCLGTVTEREASAEEKAWQGVWTSIEAKDIPTDFFLQGEYVGEDDQGRKLAAQVIALGGGHFQAVMYPGGLPGSGWDGKSRSILVGQADGKTLTLEPATGTRQYLAKPPEKFSATKQFPPAGHEKYTGTISNYQFEGTGPDGAKFSLGGMVRLSPSLGIAPEEGAIVLFDGTSLDEFQGGRIDDHGHLHTDGRDILTKRKFSNYRIHLEFMLPFRPDARGQGRGNSGFYQVDHFEVQILDSFGLEGMDNECGGVYKTARPLTNMCGSPLTWQTYDVEFYNCEVDDNGKVIKPARLTVKHNGVVIHDELKLTKKTGGSRNEPLGTPGVLKFQGHGNPLQFRNIWIKEL